MIPRNGHEWGSLGAFTGGAKTTGSIMVGEILLVIALELLDEVADEPVAKVLATKARVTGDGLDLEDTLSMVNKETSSIRCRLSICHRQPNAFPVRILKENTHEGRTPALGG